MAESLIPYCRQLLPCFNLFIRKRKTLGSGVDYAQRKRSVRDTPLSSASFWGFGEFDCTCMHSTFEQDGRGGAH